MLILSIPFISPEFVKEHCINNKFTWKEFRLDYQQQLEDFPEEVIDTSSIITIRDRSEGGICKFTEAEKFRFYNDVIDKHNCLVDLELTKYQNDLIPAENLIVSHHDFSEDFNLEKLEKIIQRLNSASAKFGKIAIKISSYSQLLHIQNLIQKSNKPVIFAGMGRLEKISRLLFKHLGAAGTFAGLSGNETAKGQITEKDIDTYSLHRISNLSRIGGIIGGKQVFSSLGLHFYNSYFSNHALDAFYFPFVVNDIYDFKNWLERCQFKAKFFGFSITMPHKKNIHPCNKPINLFLPQSRSHLNTDLLAFCKAAETLEINNEAKIIIFGNGGSAESALEVFSDYKNVYVYARKHKSKFNTDMNFISIEKAQQMEFDLLINCTPLGMNDEDFVAETGISNFKKVIDLPYSQNDTKLIKFCVTNSIPFVNGKKFWNWQAEKQLEEFIKDIK